MSIETEITRIKESRDTIRDKLVEFGLVASDAKLDVCAEAMAGLALPDDSESYTLQSKTATPTEERQSVTADEGYYGLSSVTVEPIPSTYVLAADVEAQLATI